MYNILSGGYVKHRYLEAGKRIVEVTAQNKVSKAIEQKTITVAHKIQSKFVTLRTFSLENHP